MTKFKVIDKMSLDSLSNSKLIRKSAFLVAASYIFGCLSWLPISKKEDINGPVKVTEKTVQLNVMNEFNKSTELSNEFEEIVTDEVKKRQQIAYIEPNLEHVLETSTIGDFLDNVFSFLNIDYRNADVVIDYIEKNFTDLKDVYINPNSNDLSNIVLSNSDKTHLVEIGNGLGGITVNNYNVVGYDEVRLRYFNEDNYCFDYFNNQNEGLLNDIEVDLSKDWDSLHIGYGKIPLGISLRKAKEESKEKCSLLYFKDHGCSDDKDLFSVEIPLDKSTFNYLWNIMRPYCEPDKAELFVKDNYHLLNSMMNTEVMVDLVTDSEKQIEYDLAKKYLEELRDIDKTEEYKRVRTNA